MLTYSNSVIQTAVFWRKPLIGTVFSIICVLGILAGVAPSKCSALFHFKSANTEQSMQRDLDLPNEPLALKGHHPNCGQFCAHTFQVGSRVFCAGCVGLILGAIVSLFGVITYFFANLTFSTDYRFVFVIGFVGVSCGLLQYHLFNWGRSSVHLLVNTFFVFGVFLLLVGVDGMTTSLIADSYLIALSIFWLYTRITLSQIDHANICTGCSVEECDFEKKSAEKG
jgi:hypothetical protein